MNQLYPSCCEIARAMSRIVLFYSCFAFLLLLFSGVETLAQITSPTANYIQPTQYTNGMPDDEIFVFCSPDINGNPITGSLTATPTIPGPGFSFEWGIYDENTHAYNSLSSDNGPTSTINNLASGGYNVTITNDNGDSETFITWLYVSIVDVDISLALDPVNPGCEPFDVNGTIDASGFTYWDPVDPGAAPFIIDQNTTIEVCFDANHTYVSDLGFVLVGPPSCGSPGVTLSPNPQVINNGNGCCCNSGNNLNNLCFTTASTNQLNMCGSGTPLGGTYGFYNGTYPGTGGGNYPQGGVSALYGCNAAEGGWAVQIYDCIGADVGTLTGASITFSDGTSTIIYDSGPINSAINDNSCDPNTASIYVVPLTTPIEPDPQQVPNQGTLTYQLGLNGNPVSLAPGTNSFTETIDPIPTNDEWYYLFIQDQLGCSAIDSTMFDFTGYADATIDEINANNQLCLASSPVQMTAATSGGTWSGNGVDANGLFNPSVAGIGTHTITYTVPAPCGDSDTKDITVADLTATPSSTPAVCTNENGTATLTPTSGTAPYSFNWTTTPVQTTETATDLAAGDYDVTIEDADGCSITLTVSVPFDPSDLTVNIPNYSDALCNGACDGTATAIESGGTAPYQFAWDDPNYQTTPDASGLCAGTYNVGVVDANGCLATAQVTISEPTALSVSAIMDQQSTCGQPDGIATVVATGGTVAVDYTYSWNSTPSQSTATGTNLLPGNYTATVTDDNGCSETATVNVTSTPGFTASILSSADATCFQGCDGEATAEASLGAVLPLSFSWNTTPSQSTQTASNLCAGTYDVTLTDDVGCQATTSATIQEPTAVNAILDASASPICIGESSNLSAILSGGTPSYTEYSWVADPPDATLNSAEQNPTVMPEVTTTYTFVGTDGNGCQSPAKFVTVEVLPPLSLEVVRPLVYPDTGICPYDFAVIDLVATGGNGNYTYYLEPDIQNPIQLPMQVQPNTTTTYNFTVLDGCTALAANANSTITVFELPTVDFSGDELSGCHIHTVNFTDETSPEPVSWNWNFGDDNSSGNTSPNQNPSHSFSEAGLYSVSLEVESADGCVNDTTLTDYIEVFPIPTASFEMNPERTNVLAGTIEFTDLSAPDIATWNWSFGNGDITTDQNPVYTYIDTGKFTVWLQVTTIHGCEDDVSRTVQIDPDVMFYIPNSFTPNGDGRNDYFRPYGEGVKWETFEMFIFDRWGENIYYTADINDPWNGWYKEKEVEVGVYVYKILIEDQNGDQRIYQDGVTLLR